MNNQRVTQTARILNHLESFGSITSLDAMREYGIMRLASRICDLRQAGYNITSEREQSKNRLGESVHYVRYRLKRDA